MVDYNSEIKDLEKELSTTKYNKATQHHVGLVKAKLARLKEKQETRSSKGKKGEGYSVRKTGDGTVILLGFPSVGKSTLLNAITDAESEVGSYAFTTLTVIPGTLEYKHARIQVLDVPGVVRGAASGRGRGKEVLSCMRSADLVVIVLDVHHPEHLAVLQKEVRDAGLRVNENRPDVVVKRAEKDGIKIAKTVRLPDLKDDTIKAICKEFRINNAHVLIRERITADQFIDCLERNKEYLPGIVVVNKVDMVSRDKARRVMKGVKADLGISAKDRDHIDELKELIFQRLRLMRVFLKEPRKAADMEVPLIVWQGCSIKDVCDKLHRDFVTKFRFARVWGPSARFDGQKLMMHHRLKEGDVLELHLS